MPSLNARFVGSVISPSVVGGGCGDAEPMYRLSQKMASPPTVGTRALAIETPTTIAQSTE
jgi:hypothetical protein